MHYDITELERVVADSRKVAVIGHLNPDGDAAGSVSAMCRYLEMRGKEAQAIFPNPVPSHFMFLDKGPRPIMICEGDVAAAAEYVKGCDTIFCLDFNSPGRTEYLKGAILESKGVKVLIDHHLSPEQGVFDHIWSDPDSSSTCELLFWLLLAMPDVGGEPSRLTMDCAEALYLGMMTDTNNFSNSVRPSTFEMASLLIARGVDKTMLQYRVLNSYSHTRIRLMGHLLKDNLRLAERHGAAFMTFSEAEKAEYAFRPGDTEGFVNIPLQIDGVRLSAFFSEDGPGGYVRVSLRSRRGTDVNTFARLFFNGGGHENAAGGRLYMPLSDVPAYFLKSLDDYFAEENRR